MVSTGPAILAPMYKSVVSIFANIMPYVKNLTVESWEAIMKVLEILINRMSKSEDTFLAVGNVIEGINY